MLLLDVVDDEVELEVMIRFVGDEGRVEASRATKMLSLDF